MDNNEDFTLNTGGDGTTVNWNQWGYPTRVDVIETNESIEFIYKEVSQIIYTIYPSPPLEERVFKIIFSCKDGKWNRSDRIYGEIITSSEESYEFE